MAKTISVVCRMCQREHEFEADEGLYGDTELRCGCGASLGTYQELGLGPVERLKRTVEGIMKKTPKPPKAGSYRDDR